MADIRHAIRLCERHAEEWVPDPNEIVCIYCESLTCEGPLHKYVPASQLAGAVEENGKLRALIESAPGAAAGSRYFDWVVEAKGWLTDHPGDLRPVKRRKGA
jgi:hypothetical protein